jgi:hypothetical protein
MAELLPRHFDLAQNAAPMFQQLSSCIGGGDAATIALQKMRAQFNFQLTHLSAEQRLRDVQRSGSAGKATELNNANETLQVFQIHEYLATNRP